MPPLQITINKPSPPAPLPTPDPRGKGGGGGPADLAVLEVNGQLYKDWETITVKLSDITPPYYTFRFTCSEGMPLAKNFAKLRIRPGDTCQVTLAGEAVVYGFVSTRQVFYDANRHHIEIQGNSKVAGIAYTSVIHKTMEWKDVTYEKYARDLLKPMVPKIDFKVMGGQLPQTKFPRLSIPHGMSILEALELPLRALGHVTLGSNPQGDLVANVGPYGGQDVVVEGKNILEGREIIFSQVMASHGYGVAQAGGNDRKSGSAVAHQPFKKKKIEGLGNQYRPHVMPLEIPVDSAENHLTGRVGKEHDIIRDDEVTVFATVWGWRRSSGSLWKPMLPVRVISPMLIMDGSEDLRIKSVTFTQDNAHGTRSVLELCNNRAMYPGVPPPGSGGADSSSSGGDQAIPAPGPEDTGSPF